MAGWCGINNNHPIFSFFHLFSKGSEYRNFLSTRGFQIFDNIINVILTHISRFCFSNDLIPIFLKFFSFINITDGDIFTTHGCCTHMAGWIGGSQVNLLAHF